MTNDYYVNLANYYTNQLAIVPQPSESITLNEPYVSIDFDTYFTNQATQVGASGYQISGYLNWDNSNNLVMYGYFTDGGGNYYKSFIVRLPYENGAYDISKAYCTTTYAGGTSLPRFLELKVDTDGSVYGIAETGGTYMLLMLANPFTAGGIKFRQSYSIPSTYSSYVNYLKLIKKEDTGEYLIILNNGANSTLILHLTIIIGSSNMWEATTYGYSVSVFDYYITWNESIDLYLLTGDSGGNTSLFNFLYYNGSSITLTNTITRAVGDSTISARIYNSKTVYYLVSYLSGGNAINTLYKYNLNNNTNTIVDTSSMAYSTSSPSLLKLQMMRRQQIQIYNGLVSWSYFKTDGSGSGNCLFGVLLDNNVYTFTSSLTITSTDLISFYFQSTYNDYKILMPLKSYLDVIQFQYDPNGYNGTAYISTNLFVPHRINVYDPTLTTLLLDRDLYNLKVYNNVTEATFNVPNTMLNEETLGYSLLYGETNYLLVNNYTNVTKNIYENLMINFFNSIVVKDYTGRIYSLGGNRVNDSISKTNDMENASAMKLKIFYSDNTTAVQTLNAPTITGSGNPMTITYETSIYVDSLGSVLKYQILSKDEQTLYFEYDMSSMSAGMYKVTQECSVE